MKDTIDEWWKRLVRANKSLSRNPRDFQAMAEQGAAMYWINHYLEALIATEEGSRQ